MYGGLSVKFIIVVVGLIGSFLFGAYVNGIRLEKKHQAQIIELAEKTRAVQNTITAAYVLERNKKDEEIRSISKRLADALVGLRDRPSRIESTITPIGKGATGAQLSREDAEFLTREAARADEIVADRNACYAVYESARIALGK